MKTFLTLALASLALLANAATVKMLSPLTSFGPSFDGSIQPGSFAPYPEIDSNNNQRGIAYDPVSGNLVLVDTHSGAGGTNVVEGGIYIVDGTYGTNISSLNTNGMAGGNYADAGVVVAEDGVVYVCNQVVNSGNNPFIIYRWDSVNSTDPPLVCYSNTIVPAQRYGTSIDARGTGASTQIIIGSVPSSSSGTNAVIFTTADGTNFTATVLGTDVTSANFSDGIAFGNGTTFWAKRIGAPLRLMSFDLGTASAVTLKSFDATSFVASDNLGPIAVDAANNLLAAIEVVSGITGPEHVRLYDVSDTSRAPVLLDVKDYTLNNANASAPPGYLDFGSGKLYSHVLNNGLLAFAVSPVSTPAPTILLQPTPPNLRKMVGQSVHLEVLAYPAVSYQWQKNGINILNATNAAFNLPTTTTSDAGTYKVVVSSLTPASLTSSEVVLTVVNPADLYHLSPLWSVSPSAGALYMNSTGGSGSPNQRTIAYNALSNELYIVSRGGASSANYRIYAVAATDVSATPPPVLKWLNTNGIPLTTASGAGNIALVAIGVAADGAIYACNQDQASTSSGWRLYRWANSDTNTQPQLVYGPGNPFSQGTYFRVGDVMHVRGGGTNTQIIIDNQDTGSGRFVAVLKPTDESMTAFTATYNLVETTFANQIIGRSLQWASTDLENYTYWQKHYGTTLIRSTFDPNGLIAYSNISYSVFPVPGSGPVWVDAAHNIVVGVKTNNATTPHSVELYDGTDLAAPIPIASYRFPASPPLAAANVIAQCFVSGDYVFALSGNNGLMAFKLVAGPPAAPSFLVQPKNLRLIQDGSGTMSVIPDQTAAFQWRKNGANLPGASSASYTINNAQISDAASYTCVITNQYGASTSSVAQVRVTDPATIYHLAPVWSVPINGASYLTISGDPNTPFNRSIAYSAVSNQLYIINRTAATSGLSVNVVDPNTGALLYELNTSGIAPVTSSPQPNIILVMSAVAEDGSIYAGNVAVASSSGSSIAEFHLYRWADSNPDTVPILVFSGEPANRTTQYRWGDSMAVTGSRLDTRVLIDEGSGGLAAILAPSDATLTTFTNLGFSQSYGAGPIGRSLQFGATNTFWQKRKGLPLKLSQYNLAAQSSTVLASYSEFPATLNGLALDFSRNLAAGVDFTGTPSAPDTLALYEISDLNSPMLIARYNFATVPVRTNANFIAQTILAGNRIYAIDGDNGVVAFDIVPPSAPQLNAVMAGAQVLLSWTNTFTGYTLYSTPSLTSPTWTSEGPGTVVDNHYRVTNNASGTARFYRLEK